METKINYTVRAATAVLAALVLLGVVNLTVDQLAAIGLGISATMVAVQAWFDPKVPFGTTKG